ncbi:cellulase family glycosylhydrolase [Actinoplanes sp. TBRC 11911]|uniref:cellulase family glycosylhydrolase n=1 Tax=Actinoplanes sp. TBRC 11911 TaxID=2729386 RepID=UPI00145DB355|nr:cellulase family glycosylhydrolase [Actinoplanes sp. TBRC 11911]NMO54880.1 cellulase family glycosylhydrolase [Actinoplanes sp. TBRC 11911]
MKRRLTTYAAAVLAALASVLFFVRPAYAATGLHISGRTIVEANGQPFVMRGINHPHAWYASQTSSFAAIKAAGANSVRVVLSGGRWTTNTASDVANVISMCKQNKLICVLEDHDTTGYGEDGAAYTLDQSVNYWIGLKSVLVGQEDYVVINIGNEPIGNTNPAQWTSATTAAIQKMRTNGFQHLLMIDAPNWGQDWQFVMRDNAQTVLNADTQHNTVLSIHMYAVFHTAASITSYLDYFQSRGWPLVVGEFGWQFAAGEVDDQTVMSAAVTRGIGYLGWSWSGNTDPILDMTTGFNPAQLTTWGQRIVNGTNGLKATAKQATIYGEGGGGPSTPPPTAGCAAAYTSIGQWNGGFQGEVKVTAGSAAINGWTVTLTFANGQAVTQSWNATLTSNGATVTARNAGYNGRLSAGATATFGFLGSWNGTNNAPTLSCTAS